MTAHAWNAPIKDAVVLGYLDNEIQTTTSKRWAIIAGMCRCAKGIVWDKRLNTSEYAWLQMLKRSLGELTPHERVAIEHSFYMLVNGER